MRPMAARGEVRVTVSFGPTSSPVLAHAVSYAIEHAWRTEESPLGLLGGELSDRGRRAELRGASSPPLHDEGVEDHPGGGERVGGAPPHGDVDA